MRTIFKLLPLLCCVPWSLHGATTKSTPVKSSTTVAPKAATKTAAAKPEPAPAVPRPAMVSTVSIEDIRDFAKYPKQVQSLVQSALALTHLELGYLYGSHEPAKGGMDCSGTVYHVLHFQGLKNVPRQSNEMAEWVQAKTKLHLTPTATSFDSSEFADLRPGDLLFWSNSAETRRKLPVTHVMIYLGRHKEHGKHIVFGSSDGRSFEGQRRSGVSVFDFHLPRVGSARPFHGYGRVPGLVPEAPEPVVIAAVPPAPALVPVIEKAAPPPAPKVVEPHEEVRKAVAVSTDDKATSELTEGTPAVSASTALPNAPVTKKTVKPKTTAPKKKTSTAASTTRRRSPAPPPKSPFERRVDQAVSSIQRFLQN